MTPNNGPKTFLEKMFNEYLETSDFMKKIVDNITVMATESKKIADLMLKLNERLNQQERVILTLLEIHNERERKEKEKTADYVNPRPKDKSEKPN